MDSELDTSWILDEERISNIHHNCLPEDLPYISLESVYVNKQNTVDSIVKEKLLLSDISHNILTKEHLMSIAQSHKKDNSMTQFVLKDTLLFHIPIEPEIISSFLEKTFDYKIFMKSYPILEDIHLLPSIFIFHPSNTLFFIYKEQEKNIVKKLKSALKTDNSPGNVTKRVRIKVPRKTRRT